MRGRSRRGLLGRVAWVCRRALSDWTTRTRAEARDRWEGVKGTGNDPLLRLAAKVDRPDRPGQTWTDPSVHLNLRCILGFWQMDRPDRPFRQNRARVCRRGGEGVSARVSFLILLPLLIEKR